MLVLGPRADEDFVAPNVWGWLGSGILFVAPDDSFLLTFRSARVHPPLVWGLPGGQVPLDMRDSLEDIQESAEIETIEELGSLPPVYEFSDYVIYPDAFPQQLRLKREQFRNRNQYPRFYVFRYDVPMSVKWEWEPDLEFSEGAWENDEYGWFTWEELDDLLEMEPERLMPGLVKEVTKLVPR